MRKLPKLSATLQIIGEITKMKTVRVVAAVIDERNGIDNRNNFSDEDSHM